MDNNIAKELFRECMSLINDAKTYAKVEGVNFFVQNFNRQGFLDASLQKWPARSFNDGGGAILIKSGALKRGIKSKIEGADRIIFYVDNSIKYAAIHNEGGEIVVTEKMKKFFWFLYSKSASKITKTKTGKVSKSKRNVRETGRAAFYKAMALKKVGSRIKIPQRQFMGESATLMGKLDAWIINEIDNRFK